MIIELHIERLVLDGLPAQVSHGHALRAAIETELANLLAASPPQRSRGHAASSLSAPPLRLAPNANAHRTGRDIARSLHAAIAPRATR